MAHVKTSWAAGAALLLAAGVAAAAEPRQMENLSRGVIALNEGEGKVFVSWRLLGTEPDAIAFNLYRKVGEGAAVKVNDAPITGATNFVDTAAPLAQPTAYFVRAVVNGSEGEPSKAWTLAANAPVRNFLEVPLQTPQGYQPNDASVGDLDGDGDYEIVIHMAGRARDNPSNGVTDPPIFQAYKMDGTKLWEINLGRNIREGAHYTQFMVYDLDGDGIAEVAMKTADGTTDAKGKVVGDANANWVDANGKIQAGPEYFTIFSGKTGEALATTEYIPTREPKNGWGGIGGNGGNDNGGNRNDRFLACVAYLDGVHPSVVMCRGYYGRSALTAYDWRDGKLTRRWAFDTNNPGNGKDGKPNSDYAGMGAHSISVADVDGDGKDEIVYHAMVVDDDGQGLFTTGLRHGDAIHVGDLDPDHPGLEVFGIHENEGDTVRFQTPGTALFDARTGQVLWSAGPGDDVGRGMSADVDPRYPGEEMWTTSAGLRTAKGERIGNAVRSQNFGIWWDGDDLRELLDGNHIDKWDWEKGEVRPIFTAQGCVSNNGSKSTPTLSADLFGDWREEVIMRTQDGRALRIFSTTIPTQRRIYTLMHDPQYRLAVAWQNVAYNQPPHPGFFIGDGMKAPPKPNITLVTPAGR
jgi:rhamnogalacturonan endolyase